MTSHLKVSKYKRDHSTCTRKKFVVVAKLKLLNAIKKIRDEFKLDVLLHKTKHNRITFH